MGLEMYSVREALQKDPQGTVKAVAGMGYQGLEFYAPYFEWDSGAGQRDESAARQLGYPLLFHPQRCVLSEKGEDPDGH